MDYEDFKDWLQSEYEVWELVEMLEVETGEFMEAFHHKIFAYWRREVEETLEVSGDE